MYGMYTEQQLKKMDEDDLKLLLASGLRGEEYKLVMKIYMSKMMNQKRGIYH
jgi:hypothetical protein